MTTDTKTRLLPVSGLPVGLQAFTVTKVRTWRGTDGYGAEAAVALDGKPAGTIADEGTGGGAWFRPDSAEARIAWDAFVADTPAYDLDPTREYGTDACMVDGAEAVAELLLQEALLAKKIAARHRKGEVVFVLPTMDRRSEFGIATAGARIIDEGALVWDGTEYKAVGQ